jgi:hypothetical protein
MTTFIQIPGSELRVNVDRIISWGSGPVGTDRTSVRIETFPSHVTAYCTPSEFDALIARAAVPEAEAEACGLWGGCTLPRGHNMGKADVPTNHEGTITAWRKSECDTVGCGHHSNKHQHWHRNGVTGFPERTVTDGREPSW